MESINFFSLSLNGFFLTREQSKQFRIFIQNIHVIYISQRGSLNFACENIYYNIFYGGWMVVVIFRLF